MAVRVTTVFEILVRVTMLHVHAVHMVVLVLAARDGAILFRVRLCGTPHRDRDKS
jgi:hypothetical protein